MAIQAKTTLCALALALALSPAATAAPDNSTATVARFLARTAIFFQIGSGVAEASARGSATVDPLLKKLEAAYPGVGEASILAAMADAHANGDQFTRSSMRTAEETLRARLKPGQVAQLAAIVQPIVTYLDQRLVEASAESGTPKAALLTSGYGVALEASEERSSQLTRQKGGRATFDILRALRHSLSASQAAGIPGLACHAARAGRTAGAAYLRGQGAPADVVAEFVNQPPSSAIPFDRACRNRVS